MDENKVSPIINYPSPKNRTQLKAFLGCINYYNKFIDRFSDTVQPLLKLTSKKQRFLWTETEETIFQDIKNMFLRTEVLNHPDINKPFFLQTDASDKAIGGHLFQTLQNGVKAPIIFMSRALQPTEQRFTTTEKELLAIIYCLEKTRYLILGAKLTVLTDNHALTFLRTCRLLNNRLTRWILAIQEYNFDIKHCKGSDNIVADALSRIPYEETNPSNAPSDELILCAIHRCQDMQLRADLGALSQLQLEDELLQVLIHRVKHPDAEIDNRIENNYKYHEQILYQRHKDQWLIIVPECMIDRLIWECHYTYLHCGTKKCTKILLECFIFKNLYRRVRNNLRTCDSCQRCKIDTNPPHGLARGIKCVAKNEHLALDIIGPMPTGKFALKNIIIIIDVYTKYVKLYPIKKATTKTVLNKLFGIHFLEHGLPKQIQTDNASIFKSHIWTRKLTEANITPIFSPIYHPCYNLAERPIKEIKRCLRTYCADKHKKWPMYIEKINCFLNEIHHETTGFTPNELQFDRKDVRFWETIVQNPLVTHLPHDQKLLLASRRIDEKRRKRAEKATGKRPITEFQLGDLVLSKSHPLSRAAYGETAKLFEIYNGPYRICEKLGRSNYHLESLDGQNRYGLFHVSALRKYHSPTILPPQTA